MITLQTMEKSVSSSHAGLVAERLTHGGYEGWEILRLFSFLRKLSVTDPAHQGRELVTGVGGLFGFSSEA
jgi:hypothetical protein